MLFIFLKLFAFLAAWVVLTQARWKISPKVKGDYMDPSEVSRYKRVMTAAAASLASIIISNPGLSIANAAAPNEQQAMKAPQQEQQQMEQQEQQQQEPTDADNRVIQMAFRDFNEKRFEASEKEFSMSIQRWNQLHRPRDEVVSLLKARLVAYHTGTHSYLIIFAPLINPIITIPHP